MKANIKDFGGVQLEVKSKGIELGIKDNQDKQVGDQRVTSTKLIWCPGKVTRENGEQITWTEFSKLMEKR
jgi:hypothetical protein